VTAIQRPLFDGVAVTVDEDDDRPSIVPNPLYQSRYIAYAKAQGLTPDDVYERDCMESPGGQMAPYIRWIRARWAEWGRANGRKDYNHTRADHVAFDAWLAVWVDQQQPAEAAR